MPHTTAGGGADPLVTLWLLAAGGLGALARYELAGLVQRRLASQRPWGTGLVNLLGAAALGGLVAAASSGLAPPGLVALAGTGFLGGFTTFSTWMVESVRLTEEGGPPGVRAGVANLAGQLIVGVTVAGLVLAWPTGT
jgi:CrcB protein